MSIVRSLNFKAILVTLALLIGTTAAHAQTEFSYQGRLVDNGAPANGHFDFEFNLFSGVSGGAQIAPASVSEDVQVQDGYFVTQVDFGSVFDGSEVWLQVKVRPAESSGSFDILSPRQSITRAPQAMIADMALTANSVDWANVTNVPSDLATDSDVSDLQAQVDALQAQLDDLSDQAGPFILGRSAQTSNGRFSYSNQNGIRAANQMCVDTYNIDSAHLCTLGEVQQALASNSIGAGIVDDTVTWTIASVVSGASWSNSSLQNSCQNLMYNSADYARGTRLTVDLNYQSPGNGGGITGHSFEVQQDISCGSNLPVLCCR